MPFNTAALGVALTPTVISTCVSHYLHRKSLHDKPTVHLAYDEGLHVLREFLDYACKHPIEDLQEFTRQRVPSPYWVRNETAKIPEEYLASAVKALITQLGPKGIEAVGGKEWWQWRGPAEYLRGEWIEMRSDYNQKKKVGEGHYAGQNRVVLYLHGGAYFFGSIETHRYQIQRHARKLKARIFTRYVVQLSRYRLAPQYPFPCALLDCFAAYLWLLSQYEPSEIIIAGDSAGGGLALSLLVTLRDQGLPLPAGGILISPWVDLTHSFPSIVEDNSGDYIPAYGFRSKPSPVWPPPDSDQILAAKKEAATSKGAATSGDTGANDEKKQEQGPNYVSAGIDGELIEVKDQIHMYTTNELLSHPLVSPALQPSLGGLPPLQVVTGGSEMLRDEQIYVAHKAANPTAYPPSDVYLDEYDPNGEILNKYPPTCVQLQVWDNLCHVAPALSFTRPAKYMFRSIAQFGAWALNRAQNPSAERNLQPITSSGESDHPDSSTNRTGSVATAGQEESVGSVGKAGDPLPSFQDSMIRHRVDQRGLLYLLDPPHMFPALQMSPSRVGSFNPVLVKRWLEGKQEWDSKFPKEKQHVQEQRVKELVHEWETSDWKDSPPPSSLAARKSAPGVLPPWGARKSYLMTMWNSWATKHDERIVHREESVGKDDRRARTSIDGGVAVPAAGATAGEESTQASIAEKKATEPPAATDNQVTSTGPKGIVIDADSANQILAESRAKKSTGDLSMTSDMMSNYQPASPRTHKSSLDRPAGSPLLVLPDYDNNNKRPNDENASTKALFHAPGTLPNSVSETSLPRLSRSYRPSSRADSAAGYTEDANSTVADDKSLAVAMPAADNASTQALFHSTGVVGVINDGASTPARESIDAFSTSVVDGASAAGITLDSEGQDALAKARPHMPEREVFQTADES